MIFQIATLSAEGESWTFEGFASERELVKALWDQGEISPAALDMPIADVIYQVNEVNGGELWVTDLRIR